MSNYKQLIEHQASIAATALSRFLPKGSRFALVDFPDHYNVGDSAIWLGEIALFQRVAAAGPSYVSTVESYSPEALKAACPSGPIFISGGGNFGDIYPKHQKFRVRLMGDFPDRDIIQLPQSISFSTPAMVKETADAVRRHGRFTLLVRDQASLSFAQESLGCPARLLPDMAFGIGPIQRPTAASTPVFMLLREDTERASYDRQPLLSRHDVMAADWLSEPRSFARICRWKTRFGMAAKGGMHSAAGQVYLYNCLAERRLDRGLKLLSSGRFVVTDRLHAHILSTLMDIPHVVLDNSYRKINNYMDAWTGSYEHVRRAGTAPEVIDHLRAWGL